MLNNNINLRNSLNRPIKNVMQTLGPPMKRPLYTSLDFSKGTSNLAKDKSLMSITVSDDFGSVQ